MSNINKILVQLFGLRIIRNKEIRSSVEYAIKHFGDKGIVAAEIGVFNGEHALSILKCLNVSKMYLVDPYEQYADYENTYDMKEIKRRAEKRLGKYSNKLVWLERRSSEAVHDLPTEIDFIYIDGNHQYKYVKEDMDNYYPKIKRGGILAGHDIANPRVRGVAKAFCEFVSEKKLTPNIFGVDWWIVKE